ncbi:[FeFe] hydrogenase H-cluster maturation GTPase HydF [Wansuia hejianensis]|uniref:[FeFe] hydrogenase H-cluster maturation GTPase HydF n=1 Tax=Wansuia hejianensis TaxID=2763667 RepID=A0A926IMN1_9FIRM|nr:[FeFe] hydrogenase H-cluster maturation GTPase HydF [Wansuia hejianensis]MBC8589828.1 [FeFe] hydrogenase H-cluster maturation GTPase HydF [Wansuia hejianensis]
MNSTPKANRKHIVFYGKRNAGKSSIMNKIIGQDISLVSDIKGTTTDPVSKAMELIPFGPVVFTDTGGLDDQGQLGKMRVSKTLNTLEEADCAIYVMDVEDIDERVYLEFTKEFEKRNIPYITVINKIDLFSKGELERLKKSISRKGWRNLVFMSTKGEDGILFLKDKLIKILDIDDEESTLIGDIIPYGGKVIMVIPIDSDAPKGRLILPQVQLLRDCLDHGIKSYVVRDTELESALKDITDVDLVVTDSQIFKEVDKLVPKNIKLTSFSIIMARQKGDLGVFLEGVNSIKDLEFIDNPKVLIMESCTHNTSHEDIGTVKIPSLLKRHLNKEVDFQFSMGQNIPKDLDIFDLIVHCGSCMLNKKTMINRIRVCKEKKVPITNYGILIAYITGILDRSVEIFI